MCVCIYFDKEAAYQGLKMNKIKKTQKQRENKKYKK